MSKFTKLFSLMAVLALQISLVSAQDLETGTGAQAGDAISGFNIIQNADGTFSADRDDVSVEFVPDEEEEVETEPVVSPADIAPIESAPVEEESMFSMRRITKWGGVAAGILFMLFVLMQEKGVGLSSTFGGSGGFYASKRGAEKVISYLTIIFAIAFVGLNILAMTL